MNNLECVMSALASHREARRWSDETVAIDILAQLGMDTEADAANAKPVVDHDAVTEESVVAAEAAADVAVGAATEARAALDAQNAAPVEEDHESIHGPDEIVPVAAETPDTE